jgi:MFS family permease
MSEAARDAITSQNDRILTPTYVLAWTAAFFNFFSFQLLLPVMPLYLLHIGGHESQVGLIMGVTALTALIARPLVGYIADRYGRKPLLLAGSTTYTFSSLLYNFVHAVLPLLAVRIVHGAGLSAGSTGNSTVFADLAPPHRRAEAMGIYGIAMNTSSAIAPVVGAGLALNYGFPSVFLCSAASAFVSLLLVSRLPELLVRPAHADADVRPLLFSKEALFPSYLAICLTATFGAVGSYVPVLAAQNGLGNPGLFFLPYSLTLIFTRLFSGIAADRFGRVAVLVPGLLLLVVAMLLIATATHVGALLVASIVYGLGFGSVHPALMALVVDRARPGQQGIAMSTFSGAFDLGIGGGAAAWGLVVALAGVREVFLFAALVPLAGLLLIAFFGRQYSQLPTQKREAPAIPLHDGLDGDGS